MYDHELYQLKTLLRSSLIPHSDGVTHGAEYTQEVIKTIDFLLDKSLAVNLQAIEDEMAAMHTRYKEAMGRGKGVLRNEPYFHIVRSHLDRMQQRDVITCAEKKHYQTLPEVKIFHHIWVGGYLDETRLKSAVCADIACAKKLGWYRQAPIKICLWVDRGEFSYNSLNFIQSLVGSNQGHIEFEVKRIDYLTILPRSLYSIYDELERRHAYAYLTDLLRFFILQAYGGFYMDFSFHISDQRDPTIIKMTADTFRCAAYVGESTSLGGLVNTDDDMFSNARMSQVGDMGADNLMFGRVQNLDSHVMYAGRANHPIVVKICELLNKIFIGVKSTSGSSHFSRWFDAKRDVAVKKGFGATVEPMDRNQSILGTITNIFPMQFALYLCGGLSVNQRYSSNPSQMSFLEIRPEHQFICDEAQNGYFTGLGICRSAGTDSWRKTTVHDLTEHRRSRSAPPRRFKR